MTESKHAEWLRTHGYQDFGIKSCEVFLETKNQIFSFFLDGDTSTRIHTPPCFFHMVVELEGLIYTFSFAIDERLHQWVLFSSEHEVDPEELAEYGFLDVTRDLTLATVQ